MQDPSELYRALDLGTPGVSKRLISRHLLRRSELRIVLATIHTPVVRSLEVTRWLCPWLTTPSSNTAMTWPRSSFDARGLPRRVHHLGSSWTNVYDEHETAGAEACSRNSGR